MAAFAMVAPAGAQDAHADLVDPSVATMSPDQLVEMREALMKENGGTLRNAAKLTGAEAEAAAQTLLKNFVNLPAMFPDESLPGSDALPVISERRDEFNGIFKEAETASATMLAATQSGDTAAYMDAVKTVGGTCNRCHETFRKPRG